MMVQIQIQIQTATSPPPIASPRPISKQNLVQIHSTLIPNPLVSNPEQAYPYTYIQYDTCHYRTCGMTKSQHSECFSHCLFYNEESEETY